MTIEIIKSFQIFETQEELKAKNAAIDALFGYPNDKGTVRYRDDGRKKYEGTQWAAIVDSTLIDKCEAEGMTPEQTLEYYDGANLKTPEWLTENGWYAPAQPVEIVESVEPESPAEDNSTVNDSDTTVNFY